MPCNHALTSQGNPADPFGEKFFVASTAATASDNRIKT
jgi:hypothetical protein